VLGNIIVQGVIGIGGGEEALHTEQILLLYEYKNNFKQQTWMLSKTVRI
jgi:hypothetical protein